MLGRVGMFPDPYDGSDWHRQGNPILAFLAESITETGWEVIPIQLREIRNPQQLRLLKVDVLHLHWPASIFPEGNHTIRRFLHLLPRKLLARLRVSRIDAWTELTENSGTPIVWQIHDLISHHLVGMGALSLADELLHKRVYQLSEAIIIHELSCGQAVWELHGSQKPFAVAPLGDYSRVYGPRLGKEEARSNLDISGRGRILSYIGTVRRNRNPADVVGAFLKVRGPGDLLIIAGGGVARAIGTDVDPHVLVYNGFVPREVIRDIFCASDYVINHARKYLTSAVIRTAMSYAVPVIAYPYGSALDMCRDAAVFVGQQDHALEDAITAALGMDDNRYRAMVQAAIRRNSERKWKRAGAACAKLYEQVVSSRKPHGGVHDLSKPG